MKPESSTYTCTCPDSKGGKETVVITIETCNRKTCKKSKDERDPSLHPIRDPSLHPIAEPSVVIPPPPPPPPPPKLFKLPLLCDRYHGCGCAMEIAVLEKHDDACLYKKDEIDGRNPEDDKVGNYDVIGRVIFRTCNADEVQSLSSGLDDTGAPDGDHSADQFKKSPFGIGGVSLSHVDRHVTTTDTSFTGGFQERTKSVMSQTQEQTFEKTNRTVDEAPVKARGSQTDSFRSRTDSFRSGPTSTGEQPKTPYQIRQELVASDSDETLKSKPQVMAANVKVDDEKYFLKSRLQSPGYSMMANRPMPGEITSLPKRDIRKISESKKSFPRPLESFHPIPNVASFSYKKKPSESTITSLQDSLSTQDKKSSNFFSLFRAKPKEDRMKLPKRAKKKVDRK